VAALAASGFGQTSDGAGRLFGAHLQKPLISIGGDTNGVMEVTCRAGLLGGCCFPLTSHDVTAALVVPAGIEVLRGPSPASYAAIEAPPSGTPKAWATFTWQVRRTAPDAGGELAVSVSSPDSGQVRATYALSQSTRISVGGPNLPEKIYVGQELQLVVEAACLDDDRYLKSVRFWYSADIPRGATAVGIQPGLEKQGILRYTEGGRELMVQGVPVELSRKYEPTLWRGMVAMPTNGTLCGVAVAADDVGHTACGPVVRGVVPRPRHAASEGQGWFGRLPRGAMACAAFAFVVAVAAALRRSAVTGLAAALLAVVSGVLCVMQPRSAGNKAETRDYPVEGSVAVCLFLDAGDASRRLAEQMESYRRAAPHRIHVLCFVEGETPAPVMRSWRDRFDVSRLPSAVFDGRHCVDGTNTVALTGTLDRCFNKASPRLSMELHGGVVAGRELSLGFILCNHALPGEVRGSLAAFACENGLTVGEWRCDRIVRQVLEENQHYAVPAKMCKPPFLMKWILPESVRSSQTGALILIMDESGQVVDSICTEKPCSRTGICG